MEKTIKLEVIRLKNFLFEKNDSRRVAEARGNPFITADRTWDYYLKGKANGNGGLK